MKKKSDCRDVFLALVRAGLWEGCEPVSGEGLAVRVWKNGDTEVYLPNADDDVILVFTHFLHHFFIEGVGLKQVCDWCRLLWKFRDELDKELLGKRLREMGLMSE